MRAMRVLLASCFVALSLHSPFAAGAPCAGFTDVDSTDTFCPAVTWMKSRGVTLGCAQGLYCPTGNVTRLQMAGFMSRLQRVLPLTWVDANANAIGAHLVNKGGTDGYVVRRTPGGQVVALPIAMSNFDFIRSEVYYDGVNCTGNAYAIIIGYPAELQRFAVVSAMKIYVSPSPVPSVAASVFIQSVRIAAGNCFGSVSFIDVIPVTLAEDLTATPLVAPFHIE